MLTTLLSLAAPIGAFVHDVKELQVFKISGLKDPYFCPRCLTILHVIFILGAAFPLLFKKLVAGATTKGQTELGGFTIKDYFK